MNIKDLKPASEFAQNFGIKAIVYGPAGVGKSHLLKTLVNTFAIDGKRVPVLETSSKAAQRLNIDAFIEPPKLT